MKHRYIIRTFVEAEDPEQALKIAKRTKPHEVYLDSEVFKDRNYVLTQETKKLIGYADKQRKERN